MLDRDLADLYDVPTKALNQAVHRNRTRFPEDFMFQLTRDEADNLRSQSVTSSAERAFVHLRQLLATHAELTRKLAELERRYDSKLRVVFDAIRQLMEPADATRPRPEIGFRSPVRRRAESRG
jgi:hypothetical protein